MNGDAQVAARAPKSVFLFATVGRTDLRVLARNGDYSPWNVAVSFRVREFHEWLLNNPGRIEVDSEGGDGAPREGAAFDPDKSVLRAIDEGERPNILDITTLTPLYREGRLIVVATKLGRVLRRLREGDGNDFKLEGAVFFDTRRENAPQEPIAAASVLGEWLSRSCGLAFGSEVGPGRVAVVTVVQGRESFDDRSNPLDRPLRRVIVERIVSAVAQASEGVRGAIAWLALGGGPPPLKPAVEAAVSLHFGNRVCDLDLQERRSGDQGAAHRGAEPFAGLGAIAEPPPDVPARSRADALLVRAHAIRLVTLGDFWGAATVAEALKTDQAESRWAKRLLYWRACLQGNLEWGDPVAGFLSKTSGQWAQKFDATLKRMYGAGDQAYPHCFRAALRAEAALSLLQPVDAAVWTCTFFDAALMEAISKMAGVTAGPDPFESTLEMADGQEPDARLCEEPVGPQPRGEPCLRPLRNGFYRVNTGRRINDTWCEVLGVTALAEFWAAISGRKGNSIAPNDLRNMIIHRMPRAGELNRIRSVFVEAGLWSTKASAKAFGDYFIGHKPVAAVLSSFRLNDAGIEAKRIVTALCHMIRNAPVQ